MFVATRGQGKSACESGAIEDQGVGGQAGNFAGAREALREVVLDPLVDGAKMAGEHAVLLAAQRQEVIDKWVKSFATGELDAGLSDFVQLQIKVCQQLWVGRIGSGGKGLGTRRHGERDK